MDEDITTNRLPVPSFSLSPRCLDDLKRILGESSQPQQPPQHFVVEVIQFAVLAACLLDRDIEDTFFSN